MTAWVGWRRWCRWAVGHVVVVVSWGFTGHFVLIMLSEVIGISHPYPIGPLQTMAPEIFVVSVVLTVWWNWRRQWALAYTNAACVLGFLVLLTPAVFVTRPHTPAPDAPRLRVATANVFYDNHQWAAADDALTKIDADVLTITEFTSGLAQQMVTSRSWLRYPYRLVSPQGGREVIALYSRFPFTHASVVNVGGRAAIEAVLLVGGRQLRIVLMHSVPPTSWWESEVWQRELDDLGAVIDKSTNPTIVLGDFNATRWQPAFRKMLNRSDLRDVHEWLGDGLGTSWPADWGVPPFARLDHILVRGNVLPIVAGRRHIPGSDHFALVADLAIT